MGFTVGAKVWHIPYKLDAWFMQLAAAGDLMNKSKVLIEWEKVEKKKKSIVQLWCVSTNLERNLGGGSLPAGVRLARR